jgi:hypothetical protein
MSGFQFTFTPPAAQSILPPNVDQLFQSAKPEAADTDDFRSYVKSIAPRALSFAMGERLAGFIGLMWDMVAEGAMLATAAHSLLARTFPEDALPLIGNERHLPRYPGETNAAWATRLWNAWSIWEQSGSDLGVIREFASYGATCTVVKNADWNWDGDTTASRIWYVLRGHTFTRGRKLGDGIILGGGSTLGSTASVQQVQAARKLARSQKPGHMRVERIVVVVTPLATITPNGTWASPENRSPDAIYWAG